MGIAGWRLQTITSHQAATYPTRDPTWYAPVTFILAAVEVDVAAICASIPIFYPVVAAAATEPWGRIFITHEVRITREDRFPTVTTITTARIASTGLELDLVMTATTTTTTLLERRAWK